MLSLLPASDTPVQEMGGRAHLLAGQPSKPAGAASDLWTWRRTIMGQAARVRQGLESVEVTISEDDAELLRVLASVLTSDEPASAGLRATITEILSRQECLAVETPMSALLRAPGQPIH
jgi:hypothetical protein